MRLGLRMLMAIMIIMTFASESYCCVFIGRKLTDSYGIPDSTYEYEQFDNYFYNYYDAIFIGKVERVIPPDNVWDDIVYGYEVDIIYSFKGKGKNRVRFYNSQTGGNCILGANVGDIVIIWGNYKGFFSGKIFSNGCYPNYVISKKDVGFYTFIESKSFLNDNDTVYGINRLIDYSQYDNNHINTCFSNGKLSCTGEYKSGKPDGLWKYYYLSGDLAEYGYYIGGVKTGKWYYYYNKNIMAVQNFKNGYLSGFSEYNITDNSSDKEFFLKGIYIPGVFLKYEILIYILIIPGFVMMTIRFINRVLKKENQC